VLVACSRAKSEKGSKQMDNNENLVNCEDCLWVESCDDARGEPIECVDFVAREGGG